MSATTSLVHRKLDHSLVFGIHGNNVAIFGIPHTDAFLSLCIWLKYVSERGRARKECHPPYATGKVIFCSKARFGVISSVAGH